MKMKDQCKQSVARALGKQTLTAKEATDIEAKINQAMKNLAKQDIQKWRNLSPNDRLVEAGKQVAIDIMADVKRKNKIAAKDILLQFKNLNQLDHPTLPASQVLDRMVAMHGDMSGIQSINSQSRAIAAVYRGELLDFYTNIKGGLGVWTDKALVRDIIQERFGNDSGNATAKKISDKMGEVFEGMRERFNRSGGDVGKLDDWALPQTHSAEKMAIVGRDQWVDDAIGAINRDKYVHEDGQFYSEDEIRDLLKYSFESITTNGANKLEIGRNNFGGNSKVTSRHSESRVLHFKDADTWMDYQEKYGGMQFVDLVEAHVNGLSKDIALVENLGSNPKGAMKILMDAAKQKDASNGISPDKTNSGLVRSKIIFDEFMGENEIQYKTLANIGLTYRSLNVASMLGGTVLSSATDQAMIFKTAQIHRISYLKHFGEMLSQLNPANKVDRELAHSLGLATEEVAGSIARWADDGLTSIHGKSEKIAKISSSLATQVLRVSGLNALTSANKIAFSKILMDKYGRMTRDKSWSDLAPIDRELLEGTGLNERTWEVMKLAEPVNDGRGNQLMSARSIYEIPDAKILAAMDDDVKNLVDDINNQIGELNRRNVEDDTRIANKTQRVDDAKKQLSQRLKDYSNRTDAKASAEKQALQDRIDLLDTQKEVAAAQSDINTYLQAEKQSNRIQDFLQQVEDGRHSENAATDTRSNVERNASQYNRRGEELGKRLGNAERRMVELRAKIRKADSEANKSIKQKFNELDKKVQTLDDEFTQYQTRVNERQTKRSQVADRLNKSIDSEKKELASKLRDEAATRFQAHILDEQGMAVIEAGIRERTWMSGGAKRGSPIGEITKSMMQFKSFTAAYVMRHGSRGFSRPTLKSKAAYLGWLVALTTFLGGFVVQMREIANGNDPSTMWDSDDPHKTIDFMKRSVAAGGGLSILGDILVAGMDPTGRSADSYLNGAFGQDFKTMLNLIVGNATQMTNGVETNAGNEAFKAIKAKIPAQNLWYTKAVANRMLFDGLQDMIAPGYREKVMRKAEREQGRTSWLGDFSWDDGFSDARAPDVEKAFGK